MVPWPLDRCIILSRLLNDVLLRTYLKSPLSHTLVVQLEFRKYPESPKLL